jgi:hypothetical protein
MSDAAWTSVFTAASEQVPLHNLAFAVDIINILLFRLCFNLQASKLELGQNRSIISFFSNLLLVQVHHDSQFNYTRTDRPTITPL